MRADMKKVLVSRPRVGGIKAPRAKSKYVHRRATEEFNNGPIKESMRRRHLAYNRGWNCKTQTDLFGPLRRFLQHRVGRDWNDVWSEICRHADARDIMGQHLRFHIRQYVAHVQEGDDGKLYDEQGYVFTWQRGFYVDPKSNTLCQLETKKPRSRRVTPSKVFMLDGRLFHKHDDGNWYLVNMAPWKDSSYVVDCFIGYLSSDPAKIHEHLVSKYGVSPTGAVWYATHKDPATREESKKLTQLYALRLETFKRHEGIMKL